MRFLSLFVFLIACKGGDDTAADSADSAVSTCVSGATWAGGDQASPSMYPGRACIACHEERGVATVLSAAGTVYTEAHEPDDCNGVGGATIEVTDASGATTRMFANTEGNFLVRESQAAFQFPITAKITLAGQERVKQTPVSSGDCNSCHAATGQPGRLQVPAAE